MTLKKIEIDLQAFKIHLYFQNGREPLIIHFDTPSRKFYFALICFIVHEMKQQDNSGFVSIRKHQQTLRFLDNALAGPYASKSIDGMWEKIRKAWHYTLPNLEEAANFKIEGREQVSPYEKGGKFLYDCNEDECDAWSNLFGIDEITNKWRYRFASETAGLDRGDVVFRFGDLQNSAAWQAFLNHLEENSPEDRSVVKSESIALRSTNTSAKKSFFNQINDWGWYKFAITTMMIFLLLICGIVILNQYLRPESPPTIEASNIKPSIAILPFVNVSDNPEQEYFCDGITEELIHDLAMVKDLRVISRTSAFYFKDKGFDIRTIAEKLNVSHLLEGSVRIADGKLRISAQLINAADDSHVWAETYDREMKDIFETQDELAEEIACNE